MCFLLVIIASDIPRGLKPVELEVPLYGRLLIMQLLSYGAHARDAAHMHECALVHAPSLLSEDVFCQHGSARALEKILAFCLR